MNMGVIQIYGIRNCNTVKNGLEWLKKHRVDYEFHDFKVEGVTDARLKAWVSQVGWESLVNRKGLTWRQLDDKTKASITSAAKAIPLMKARTSVIKRPIVERDGRVLALGFDEDEYGKVFS